MAVFSREAATSFRCRAEQQTVAQIMSPLRGLISRSIFPGAYAPGYDITPLRGSIRLTARAVLCLFVIIITTQLLTGCTARVSTDPIKDMNNLELSANWRLDAARQAEREVPNDPRRYAALHKLVWDKQNTEELRIYAIDQLVQMDEKDFIEKLDRRIVLIPYGEALDHIYEVGKAKQWPQLTPMLVKRWAVPQRGVPDQERTERKWISELNPGRDPRDVAFDVFTASPEKITDLQRIGAWALLNRIATQDELMAALARAPQTTALISDLKASAADLHTLPRHREGVKWLYYLRDPARGELWQRYKTLVATLGAEQRANLELKHLAILPHLGSDTLALSHAQLYARVSSKLEAQHHYFTGSAMVGLAADHPQRLHDWRTKLSWADLATIELLWEFVQQPAIKASLFAQADKDLLNQTSEHGGVLDIVGDKPIVRDYPPIVRYSHDRQFTPSEQMITHCYTALAHYHFHAQEKKNAQYAGPGMGDLDTADRLDLNFLVFTFVDENHLNVDYYQHGRVVVDMGTISR